jgi:hypothetical protein
MENSERIVVVKKEDKSAWLALILTFLFGGLGMFYVSILSGIIWTIAELFIGSVTVGIGLVIFHPLMMLIAILAIRSQNKKSNKVLQKKLDTSGEEVVPS